MTAVTDPSCSGSEAIACGFAHDPLAGLIHAKASGADPYEAIEVVLPWDIFTATALKAGKLARDESFDHLRLVGDYYTRLRRYEPAFLAMFELRGAPVAAPLLAAVDCLREVNDSKVRKPPATVPIEFLRKPWKPLIFTPEQIDRKFDELATMWELKNALRAGDVSVLQSTVQGFRRVPPPRRSRRRRGRHSTRLVMRSIDDRLSVRCSDDRLGQRHYLRRVR